LFHRLCNQGRYVPLQMRHSPRFTNTSLIGHIRCNWTSEVKTASFRWLTVHKYP
jgi:hypothetical protein